MMSKYYSQIIICSVATLSIIFVYKRYRKKTIPGPFQWPIVGNSLSILPYLKDSFPRYLMLQRTKYGRIFKYSTLTEEVVVITDAETARFILKSGDSFVRGNKLSIAGERIFDHSLFLLPTGADWYRHRKCIMFSNSCLATYIFPHSFKIF